MYDDGVERRALDVTGLVQGVGFRPFVHGLASRLKLSGFVTNNAGGVQIEVEGDAPALAEFERELARSAPPLARIESIGARRIDARGERVFRIESSRVDGERPIYVCPDVATCDACVRELFDRSNRRYRYPFINCTACGPRLTIVTGSPYDRARTTMSAFEMCRACRAEYLDPANRRFHAEPIACADCGPRLYARDSFGRLLAGDPIEAALAAVASGQIVAVKGLGGFHLACDARNAAAAAALRQRKHRDDKPFAIMVRDAAAAAALTIMSASEAALLDSGARPIVLLDAAPGGAALRDLVAPGTNRLGVMLPYTPLHHLLLAGADGPLVMTSGNRSDEPIAIDNEEAQARLRGVADVFLVHDRTIRVRCDDSVVRDGGAAPILVRRSRGYAPVPIRLPFSCREPILAVGGQLKNTFALGRGAQAFVSHHLGDLDELTAFQAFERFRHSSATSSCTSGCSRCSRKSSPMTSILTTRRRGMRSPDRVATAWRCSIIMRTSRRAWRRMVRPVRSLAWPGTAPAGEVMTVCGAANSSSAMPGRSNGPRTSAMWRCREAIALPASRGVWRLRTFRMELWTPATCCGGRRLQGRTGRSARGSCFR